MTPLVDLRSDTLTRPVPAMRTAMAEAEVGDDVYGEDPTVAALERRVADLLGHEAGLFMPSGSLANQIGMRLHVAPGEEVLADSLAHVLRAEMGAAAAFSGITSRSWVAPRGLLDPAQPLALMQPDAGAYQVSTRLVVVENTHNFGGGTIQPLPAVRQLREATREQGVALHLDGARLWNALRRHGHRARGVRRAVRHRVGVPEQGPRRPGRLGARRQRAGDGGRPDLAQALRRRHAPGRHPRRRWAVGAGTPSRPARRGPRPGPVRGPGGGQGRAGRRRPRHGSRPTSSSWTSARPGGRPRPSSRRPASGDCGCTPPTPGRCGWSGISTWTTPRPPTLLTWSAR